MRMVTYVVDRKRDEVSDIRDELEMVSACAVDRRFCLRVFFCCDRVRWCGGRVPLRALFQSA